MTREEIIEAIADDKMMPYIEPYQLSEIVNFVIKNYKPSLPSNLDEAAEEYGRKEYSHAIHFWDEGLSKNKPKVMKEDFVDSFRAGAEWMAGQGWSRELEVEEDAGGYPYIDKHIELYDYDTDTPLAKKGDKVIVQIRKA